MTTEPLWYQNAIFYEVNVRAFYDSNADGHGDLPGLIEKLDYLKDLGVNCIWVMPIYDSPLRDDGYDISDFLKIQPVFGNVKDFQRLIEEAHARGMRVITDMIMNHTSDQHPWFQAARSDPDSPYRDFYVWSDNREKYSDARIIFLDTEESNWSWDEKAQQYYWHRFYASQPDLNYDNPAVLQTMLDIMKFWLDMGIDGFRADAVPYLIEREGTNCENLPETHAILKKVRAFIDKNYPGRILLAEANQWPKDVLEYFGNSDEFHMGFHFPVMPRIFMALRKADRSSLIWILEQTPPIPKNCQWCTFLRNHDELTLEMVTEEERQWMWQQYAPDPRMRLNLGIRRRQAPLLDNDPALIRLANVLLFSLPGTPIIYYGDEIGMGDNIWLFDRNGVRTPMQWDKTTNAGFSSAAPDKLYAPVIEQDPYGPKFVNTEDQLTDPNSLFNFFKRLIEIRKANPAFSVGNLTWLDVTDPGVVAISRVHEGQTLVAILNLSPETKNLHLQITNVYGSPLDLWKNEFRMDWKNGKIDCQLSPRQYIWLKFIG
jgi:maltose alpha-D-glucosyltransferase/alpha-amylase